MREKALLLVLLVALALSGCRESGDGKLFEVSGRLFEFNYRLARATYVVTLNPLRPMREGQVAIATFENPAGGPPFVVNQPIWPKMRHVTLTSPPLTCVVKNRPYSVSIHIKDKDGAVLQEIKTTLISNMDQTILPDEPLVTGPNYELNPDLVGHPDGKLPGTPKADCPKTT